MSDSKPLESSNKSSNDIDSDSQQKEGESDSQKVWVAELFEEMIFGSKEKTNSYSSADGGIWKQETGHWNYYNNSHSLEEKYLDVVDVSQDQVGNLAIKLKNGDLYQEKIDGSQLKFNDKNKCVGFRLSDGKNGQFIWDGDELEAYTAGNIVWQRAKEGDKYLDKWVRSDSQSYWVGKIEFDDKTGNLVLTDIDGDDKGDVIIHKTDGSKEIIHANQSRKIVLANKLEGQYDANGNLTKLTYPDKTIREFGWQHDEKTNQYILNSVVVKRADGSVNEHKLIDGAWYLNDEKEKNQFTVDSKKMQYSYVDTATGSIWTSRLDNGFDVVKTNDDEYTVNKYEQITQVKIGDKTREYNYLDSDSKKPSEIYDKANNIIWKLDEDNNWVSDKGEKIKGKAIVDTNGNYSFVDGNSTKIFHIDGTRIDQIKSEIDGSTIERRFIEKKIETKITHADGAIREYLAIKNSNGSEQIISETRHYNGQKEIWERQRKANSLDYSDIWQEKGTSKTEERIETNLSDNGEFVYKTLLGNNYSAKTDGTEQLANEEENWLIDYKNGKVIHLKRYNGTDLTYEWDGDTIKSYVLKDEEGKVFHWTRVAENQYQNENVIQPMKVSVSRDGLHMVEHLEGDKSIIAKSPSGYKREEYPNDKRKLEWYKEKLLSIDINGHVRRIERDAENKVFRITDSWNGQVIEKDIENNWVMTRNGQKIAHDTVRLGDDAAVSPEGDCAFISCEGTILIDKFDGTQELLMSGGTISREVVDHPHLDLAEKIHFIRCLNNFENRKDLSIDEVEATIDQIQRVLNSKNDSLYNERDNAILAAQLAWHVAHPNLDSQGTHPTCSVSDIRLCLEYENPALFVQVMADMIVDKQFITKDKTKIIVAPDSIARTEIQFGSDNQFPSEDGQRSWAARIWDMTAINIHWQRQSKGSIYYRQDTPSIGEIDEGLYQLNQEGSGNPLYNENGKRRDTPGLSADEILDVYKQITGQSETNRVLLQGTVTGSGSGVASFTSEDDLHKLLLSGPWPKIIHIESNEEPFGTDTGSATANNDNNHRHVVVITRYDAESKKVYIDNTWSNSDDHLDPTKPVTNSGTIPLEMFYKATH